MDGSSGHDQQREEQGHRRASQEWGVRAFSRLSIGHPCRYIDYGTANEQEEPAQEPVLSPRAVDSYLRQHGPCSEVPCQCNNEAPEGPAVYWYAYVFLERIELAGGKQ